MSWLTATVLGLVQGLTEFLPISSSAHLRIVAALAGWPDPGAAFTAVTQLGTETAVLAYFRRDIATITATWARSLRTPSMRREPHARLGIDRRSPAQPAGRRRDPRVGDDHARKVPQVGNPSIRLHPFEQRHELCLGGCHGRAVLQQVSDAGARVGEARRSGVKRVVVRGAPGACASPRATSFSAATCACSARCG